MADISWNELKLVVDGKEMPAPTDYEIELSDQDGDSVRNIKDAVLSRVVIRKDIKKINLKYSMNDMNTVSTVLNMLYPDKIAVQCFDEKTIARVTKYMYCNKKTYGVVCVGGNAWAKSMNFSLVEY
jgi:hypothetical protein